MGFFVQLFKICQWKINLFMSSIHLYIHPMNPRRDQHLISPYNINHESHIRVMRIEEMVTTQRSFWSVNKFSMLAT